MEKVLPFGLFDVSSCDSQGLCFCGCVTIQTLYPHCITLEAYNATPEKVDTMVKAGFPLLSVLSIGFSSIFQIKSKLMG